MADNLSNLKNSIGKHVCLTYKKFGTLQYCGNVLFAKGLWCGVELDDGSGDNDGSINNISYFSCQENHGLFIPASEINITDDGILSVANTKLVSWCNVKSSKNMSKEFGKVTDEVASSKEKFDMSESFVSLSNFALDQDSLPRKEESEEHFDSDESLGILSLHLLDDKYFEDDLFLEKQLSTEIHQFQPIVDNIEFNIDAKNNTDANSSSVCNMPKILLLPTSDESSPSYSSTPKHESNYMINLDEEFVRQMSSSLISSPVVDMNKTTVIKKGDENSSAFELNKTFLLEEENSIMHKIQAPCFDKEKNVACLKDENIRVNLNTTVLFSNDSSSIHLKEQFDNNIQSSDSFDVKNMGYQDSKKTSIDVLNITTSISKEIEDKLNDLGLEEKHVLDSTFVKIPELPNVIHSEVQAQQISKQIVKAKSAKRIYPDPFSIESANSRYSKLDKNKIRKSENLSRKNVLMENQSKKKREFPLRKSMNLISHSTGTKKQKAVCSVETREKRSTLCGIPTKNSAAKILSRAEIQNVGGKSNISDTSFGATGRVKSKIPTPCIQKKQKETEEISKVPESEKEKLKKKSSTCQNLR